MKKQAHEGGKELEWKHEQLLRFYVIKKEAKKN